ncbi:MAG: hypothetical protein RLZ65_803 [Actinomycetota bacterium]
MKNTTTAAIALAAAITAGGLAMAIPSQAASSESAAAGSYQQERGDHSHATISATVTGIPSTVTNSFEVGLGAYFSVYELADGQSAPAVAPTESRRVHVGMGRGHGDQVAVSSATLTSDLRLPGVDNSTTKRFAFYPSDGSAPSVVTIAVDANGVAKVTTSKPLTVAYSATVAADSKLNQPEHGKGRGHGDERGHRGGGVTGKGDRDGHRGGEGHRH